MGRLPTGGVGETLARVTAVEGHPNAYKGEFL